MAIGTGFNAAASELAQAVSGSEYATTARDAGIAVGTNAKLIAGPEVHAGGSVTIGETGIADKFAQAIRDVTERNTTALTTLATREPSVLPSPMTIDTPSPQAASAPSWLWTVLALAVGLAALAVVANLFRR